MTPTICSIIDVKTLSIRFRTFCIYCLLELQEAESSNKDVYESDFPLDCGKQNPATNDVCLSDSHWITVIVTITVQ